MTPERFKALVESYGADPKRWPEAERVAASKQWQDPAMQPYLAEAQQLDHLLAADRNPFIGEDLIARIVATAPTPTVYFWQRWPWWLTSTGAAGIGLAGALASSMAVTMLTTGTLLSGTAVMNSVSMQSPANEEVSTSEMLDFTQDWR